MDEGVSGRRRMRMKAVGSKRWQTKTVELKNLEKDSYGGVGHRC